MNHYCLGFLFNKTQDHVALIRRIKKDWQEGKLNGIGGNIEPGESDQRAMAREFFEETGVKVPQVDWQPAIHYSLPGAVLHIFVAVDKENKYITRLRETGSGQPGSYWVEGVCQSSEVVPNLGWIIPMLLDFLTNPQSSFDIVQSGVTV